MSLSFQKYLFSIYTSVVKLSCILTFIEKINIQIFLSQLRHIIQVTQRAHFLLGLAPSADDSTVLAGKDQREVLQLAEKWDSILPHTLHAKDGVRSSSSGSGGSPSNSPKNSPKNKKSGKSSVIFTKDTKDTTAGAGAAAAELDTKRKEKKDTGSASFTASSASSASTMEEEKKQEKKKKKEQKKKEEEEEEDEEDKDEEEEDNIGMDFLKYLETGKYAPPTILLTLLARRQRRAEIRIRGLEAMTIALQSVVLPSVLADLVQWIRPSLRGVSSVERHLELCEA